MSVEDQVNRNDRRKVIIISTCLLLGVSLGTTSALAGSPVFVGSKATANTSLDVVDHAPWDQLLRKYVNDDGMVNYQSWKANAADVKTLDRYLESLSAGNTSAASSKQSKLAFWINAYNAVTIRGILTAYPTSSIRNHTAKLFGYNIWHDLQLYVGGTPYSLDTIEHKILRKMSEPRIHFAIVCASIGCPRLLNEAYVPGRVDEQLELNTKDFFGRNRNFRFDASGNRFYLSSILDWFEEDFGPSQQARLKKISLWFRPIRPATPRHRASEASRSWTMTGA